MRFSKAAASFGLLWLCSAAAASQLGRNGKTGSMYTRTRNNVNYGVTRQRIFQSSSRTPDADEGAPDNSTSTDLPIPPGEVEATVDLPLNHSNPSGETFRNRFFVDDSHFSPEEGGPIMVFDNGEATATPPGYITQVMKYAEEQKAMVISWEHRYYGKSLPNKPKGFEPTAENVDPEELAEWYKHHNIDNALDDLAMFAKNFTWKRTNRTETEDFGVGKAPWIMVGGSYPGVRVAWMQVRHPGVFDFGLASSAPVGFMVDYWQYFLAAERAMAKFNLTGCRSDIHTASNWLSDAYAANNITAFREFGKKLAGPPSANGTSEILPEDATIEDWAVTVGNGIFLSPFNGFQQSSIYSSPFFPADKDQPEQPAQIGTADFCRYFQSGANTTLDFTPGFEGLSAKMDAESVAMMYAKALGDVYNRPRPDSGEEGQNQGISPTDDLSWFYQTCTQVGSVMTGLQSHPSNLVPSFVSIDGYIQDCQNTFGTGAPNLEGLTAANERLHEQFGGKTLELGNVVWTNGEFDPWRMLTGDADVAEDGGKTWSLTAEIPPCGERLPKGVQIGYTIKNAVHANDFDDLSEQQAPEEGTPQVDPITGLELTLPPKNEDIKGAQDLWRKAMTAWLKKGCAPKP